MKNKIVIVTHDGIVTDIYTSEGMEVEVEAVQIDRDSADYQELCKYEERVSRTMCSVGFTSVNFEDRQET